MPDDIDIDQWISELVKPTDDELYELLSVLRDVPMPEPEYLLSLFAAIKAGMAKPDDPKIDSVPSKQSIDHKPSKRLN